MEAIFRRRLFSHGSSGRVGQLLLLPLLATLGYYASFIYLHAINVPLADDIYDVLQPLVRAESAESGVDVLAALYHQHTDHRTIASRLVYATVYLVHGEIDFRILNFLANLALPLLLFSLYVLAAGAPHRLFLILPAALLLFQPRAYGITFWAMASFAYFYVFLYGFAAVMFTHNADRGRLAIAIAFATLSSFTLASGQMVWVVGLASLAQQSYVRRSIPWHYPGWWLLSALVVLVLWRVGLDARFGPATLLANFFQVPGHYVLYTLTLLGSAISDSSVAWAATTGGALLVALCASTVLRWRSGDIRLELCCWFIVLSVMTMALGRGFAEVDYGLTSRYSFPSVLMFASMWVLLAVRLRVDSWQVLLLASALALLYNVCSFRVYSQALQPYMERRVEDFNRGFYRSWPNTFRENKQVVTRAIRLGIYSPPAAPLPKPELGSKRVPHDK